MNERNLEVLEQYELEVGDVRKGRGAFLCETGQGLKLLKEYRGTVKRLEFEDEVLRHLKEEKGLIFDQYVKTKEENLLSIAGDGTKYVLKDWFSDRECDLRSEKEVRRAVRGLAALHKALRNIEWKEEWNLGSITVKPVSEEMLRHNRELIRVRNFIRNKRQKSEFELCVIRSFNKFYEQAEAAARGLNEMKIEKSRYLCHGDMNQHHILIREGGGENILIFTEFNKMHLGLQVEDLYRLVRKTLEKQEWCAELGTMLLEEYNSILPLTREDRASLYYLFLYPEKYWKQMNFYFNNNKAWIPVKNIEKLVKLEEQFYDRDEFLQKIYAKIERL